MAVKCKGYHLSLKWGQKQECTSHLVGKPAVLLALLGCSRSKALSQWFPQAIKAYSDASNPHPNSPLWCQRPAVKSTWLYVTVYSHTHGFHLVGELPL